ncbi:phosphate ABC transporter permease subunit PstC, partial [Leuconostoc mesenteroides]
MDNITKKLMQRSESTHKDTFGRAVSLTALALIGIVVVAIFAFVLSR